MDFFAKSFVAVDFETATANRMICQIGLAVVENGQIVETISEYVQPPKNYYEGNCVKIHHIRPHVTAESPTFDKLWPRFKPYFENNVVVSHSAFDDDTLRKNLHFYGISDELIPRFKDSSRLFGKSYSLVDSCVGLCIPIGNHHDAREDAVMCANVYLRYLAGVSIDTRRIVEYKNSIKNGKPSSTPHVLNIEHFENQHLKFYQMVNVITNKEIYVDSDIQGRRDCFFQLIGNLGGFANEDLSNETQLCLLSNKTYKILKEGGKNETTTAIQAFYDNQPGPPYVFDFEYMTERDFLDFVELRCEKTPDVSTITLYNIYMSEHK